MNDFKITLLGEMSTGAFWAFFLLGILGMVVSWVTQYADNRAAISLSGGFKLSTWFLENWPRLIVTPIVIILVILLFKDMEGRDISKLAAVETGLMADVMLDRIRGAITKRKQ